MEQHKNGWEASRTNNKDHSTERNHSDLICIELRPIPKRMIRVDLAYCMAPSLPI